MLSESRLRELLVPYTGSMHGGVQLTDGMLGQLSAYLDLLVRWNARTNLTAVREPEEMVTRHFGESLFAGGVLAEVFGTRGDVLDLGSGAGFPGLPIQILLPDLSVILAESQGKKAAFLREVVRVLGLKAEVWAGRVEDMAPERRFDAVTMRAVDRMGAMEDVGRSMLRPGGLLVRLTSDPRESANVFAMPESELRVVEVTRVAQ